MAGNDSDNIERTVQQPNIETTEADTLTVTKDEVRDEVWEYLQESDESLPDLMEGLYFRNQHEEAWERVHELVHRESDVYYRVLQLLVFSVEDTSLTYQQILDKTEYTNRSHLNKKVKEMEELGIVSVDNDGQVALVHFPYKQMELVVSHVLNRL